MAGHEHSTNAASEGFRCTSSGLVRCHPLLALTDERVAAALLTTGVYSTSSDWAKAGVAPAMIAASHPDSLDSRR